LSLPDKPANIIAGSKLDDPETKLTRLRRKLQEKQKLPSKHLTLPFSIQIQMSAAFAEKELRSCLLKTSMKFWRMLF
jgi:hypothetical protein